MVKKWIREPMTYTRWFLEGAYFALGLSLNLSDRLEEAASLVDLPIEFNGDDYNAYVPYITTFLRLGDKERVSRMRSQFIRILEMHLEWAPENARARMLLAGSYAEGLGDERRALDELEKALAYSPNDASLLMNGACTYALLGRKTEALTTLKKSVENGYRHADTILRDPDLASLRGDPEFEAIVKSLS
jgi:tetratricopeptide (TPR) repeat protein